MFSFCAGCAEWDYGGINLVSRYLQLEEPSHNCAGAPSSLDSCVVSRASTSHRVPLHVSDWGLELPVSVSNPTIHGCEALTGGAYW